MTARQRHPGRRLIANVDCEVRYARADAAERRERGEDAPSPRDPRFSLRPTVLARAAALASLLRVRAEEGDILWLPAPVDPLRLPSVPGVPDVLAVETGPLPASECTAAWAREDAAARRANDRELGLRAARAARVVLPGACVIRTIADLEATLRAGGLAAAHEERWVLKAPFGSAGRNRVLGRGARPGREVVKASERLLALFGRAVFEPWMDRVADEGFVVDPRGSRHLHVQRVDAGGVIRGIRIADGLGSRDEAREAALAAVATELAACGYDGVWEVDGFRYRDESGVEHLHPLCEVNARWTFGALARVAIDRVAGALGRPPVGELLLGDEAGLRAAGAARGQDVVPMLLPGAPDGTAAWLLLGDAGGPPHVQPGNRS